MPTTSREGDLNNQENPAAQLSPSEESVFQCIEVINHFIEKIRGFYDDDNTRKDNHRKLQALCLWSDYLLRLVQEKRFLDDPNLLIEQTALLLETFSIEEIVGVRTGAGTSFNDFNSVLSSYGRSEKKQLLFGSINIPSNCFFTLKELELLTTTREGEMLISLNSAEDTPSINNQNTNGLPNTYLLRFRDITEFQKFRLDMRKNNQRPKGGNLWFYFCSIPLSDTIGCQLCINSSGKNVSVAMSSTHLANGVNQPITPPPMTDILRALLSQPYDSYNDFLERKRTRAEAIANIAAEFNQTLDSLSREPIRIAVQQMISLSRSTTEPPMKYLMSLLASDPDLETWRRAAIYKQLLRIKRTQNMSDEQRQAYLLQLEEKHQNHYRRLLADPSSEFLPSTLLTRSGVSSNGVALMATNKIFQDQGADVVCFTLDGWYYENEPPETWEKSQDLNKANVLLVDSEPNGPSMKLTAEEYARHRDTCVNTFVQRALADPNHTYVLITDKTSRLLDHDYLPKSNLPANLVIYETASLTKHQRGAKNNYFGVVSSWNNPLNPSEMSELRTAAMGELTADSIINLPRLRASEIRDGISHNFQLSKIIEQVFEQAQVHIPEESRWRWQSYNYFGFILPPSQLISDFNENPSNISSYLDGSKLMGVINYFFTAEPEASKTFEKGDSFGLNNTRFIPFGVPLEKSDRNLKQSERCIVYRVSFGRKTSEENMLVFAQHLVKHLLANVSQP